MKKELENIEHFKERMEELQQINSTNKIEASNNRAKLDVERAFCSRVIFEKDSALQKLDLVQQENDSLKTCMEEVRHNLMDEIDMHNANREVFFLSINIT